MQLPKLEKIIINILKVFICFKIYLDVTSHFILCLQQTNICLGMDRFIIAPADSGRIKMKVLLNSVKEIFILTLNRFFFCFPLNYRTWAADR